MCSPETVGQDADRTSLPSTRKWPLSDFLFGVASRLSLEKEESMKDERGGNAVRLTKEDKSVSRFEPHSPQQCTCIGRTSESFKVKLRLKCN